VPFTQAGCAILALSGIVTNVIRECQLSGVVARLIEVRRDMNGDLRVKRTEM
jgi:hypothetical protein